MCCLLNRFALMGVAVYGLVVYFGIAYLCLFVVLVLFEFA